MKNLIYSLAIITLMSALTSCTADDIENPKPTTIQTQLNASIQKDGDIDPPKFPLPSPPSNP